MHIIELSEKEYFARLETPYHPPDDSISDEQFDEEYYRLFDRLEPLLADFGSNDAYGAGDYYLEPRITRSRGLGFEVTNDDIVTEIFLGSLQHLVATHSPEWELYLRSDGWQYGIFVGPTEVRIHRNGPDILPYIRPAAPNVV